MNGKPLRKFLIAAVALFAIQLCATSVIPMSVEQLTTAATSVVRARAISSESRWSDDHGSIYTFTRFQLLETWKGAPVKEFTVRQMGGRVGTIEQKVSGVRRWNNGDEAVLFLRPSEVGNGVMAVVGLFQGNFAVMQEGTQKIASNGAPEALQFDPATHAITQYHAARFTVRELHQRVSRAAGQ